MRQIGLVLLAMGLGLGVGRFTGGFSFSPAVCIVAAVFLVTPSLLRLEREDLRFALHELRPIGLDLALNFVVLAGVALGLGWLTGDLGLAGALLLLALLPGGGMVMHWIRMSGADLRLGFLLSAVNLAMVLPVTLLLAALPGLLGPAFAPPDLGAAMPGPTIRVPPFAPFMVLVVVPFALSRWLKADAPRLVRFVERHGRSVAQVTIGGIVFYLFGLRSSQLVFEMPAPVLAKAVAATAAFYAAAIVLAGLAMRGGNAAEGRAVYWHIVTRYITLALILASFSVQDFGASFLLPIMIAYVIQFSTAPVLARRLARP